MLSAEVVQEFIEKNEYFLDNVTTSSNSQSIDRVDGDIKYERFFTEYLLQNKPCLISKAITETWRSRKEWVLDGKPNFLFLKQNFGSAIAPIADCDEKEYNSQHKENMELSKYLEYWQTVCDEPAKDLPCWYLKDWHFNKKFSKYEAYSVPKIFSSDWLNEVLQFEDDDYQFVYMGPIGTWTPLHMDVFGSYSWSVNLCGKKKWILFSPDHEKNLCKENGEIMYSVTDGNIGSMGIEVLQEAGEVLFVPSGWFHQVWNVDHCISINHNWFNGVNANYIWDRICIEMNKVEHEISDCNDGTEDWENQCQMILKIHHGMNYNDFFKLLLCISADRLSSLLGSDEICNWHYVFDIYQIYNVICLMKQASNISRTLINRIEKLCAQIEIFFKSQKITAVIRSPIVTKQRI